MIVEIISSVILFVISYIIYIYMKHLWLIKDYPKGPFPLPIFGNLLLLYNKQPQLVMETLREKYGDIYSMSFGMKRIVIVNRWEDAMEALVDKAKYFSGRTVKDDYYTEIFSRGYIDIALSDYGDYWKQARKLGSAALRMVNMDNGNAESKIINESKELHTRLVQQQNVAIDITKELDVCVFNMITNVLFGVRYKPSDEEFHELQKSSNVFSKAYFKMDLNKDYKWLRHVYHSSNYKTFLEAITIRDIYLKEKLEEHKQTYNPDTVRDFTDSLIKLAKEDGNSIVQNDDSIELILYDMIFAGAETTSTTLQWSVLYLIHWPEYQEEIRQEIKKVAGFDKYPELCHLSDLHTLNAFIHEAMRYSSIIPIAMHKASESSSIGHEIIPKEAPVFFNLWSMHHDIRHWKKPYEFDVARWLDENGKFIGKQKKSFLPFSAGKRVCVGESLARKELVLLLGRLVTDFQLIPKDKENLPSLIGNFGSTISPTPFAVLFKSL